MELPNISDATTREVCAKRFASAVATLLTYLTNHVSDKDCAAQFMVIRKLFRTARDSLLPNEMLLENVGSALHEWRAPLQSYDDSFFRNMDIAQLLGSVATRTKGVDSSDASKFADLRARFFEGTTETVRTAVLDALNLMLILYARYVTMRD